MAEPQLFSIRIDESPKVRMGEISGRPGVYVFWYAQGPKGKSIAHKVRWPIKVRTSTGKVDRDLKRKAEDELERIHTTYASGVSPAQLRGTDELDAETRRDDPTTFTLAEGFARIFDPVRGRYRIVNANVRDLKHLRTLIEMVLAPDRRWASLDADAAAELSLGLASYYPDDGGFRSASRAVDLLFRTADYLRVRKLIPVDACQRPKEWAAVMRREWRDLGKAIRPSRPRYTAEEMQTLLISTAKADPRLRRAFEVGPELRAVQIRKIMRSHVIFDRLGDWGLGRLFAPGEDQKQGTWLDIDPGLFDRLEKDMATGDLAEFESRHQARQISDYPLFPTRQGNPISKRRFRELFEDYEAECGVEHKPKRGWHGMRRTMSTRIEDETDDESVRKKAGAWAANSSTRDDYRDDHDPRLLAKTRQIVMRTRRNLMGSDPEVEIMRQEAQRLIFSADRSHLEAALATLKSPKPTTGPTTAFEVDSA